MTTENGTTEIYDSEGNILSHVTAEGYRYSHQFATQRDVRVVLAQDGQQIIEDGNFVAVSDFGQSEIVLEDGRVFQSLLLDENNVPISFEVVDVDLSVTVFGQDDFNLRYQVNETTSENELIGISFDFVISAGNAEIFENGNFVAADKFT